LKLNVFTQVIGACVEVLAASEPTDKMDAAFKAADILNEHDWRLKEISLAEYNFENIPRPPDQPAKPAHPELVSPTKLPKRRLGNPAGRAALMHAVAHIEFNAINMAFDMAVRFTPEIIRRGLDGRQFLHDWINVGREEAIHFELVYNRLKTLEQEYGTLPAHDGLWEAAHDTSDEVLARLAIAPMVLEARGLDVTPAMITALNRFDDQESAAILQRIYDDEIGHVATGSRWFRKICVIDNREPVETFQNYVKNRFHGQLKEPFNHEAREKAGIELAFYQSWMTDFVNESVS